MSPSPWRLLSDGTASGPVNMGVDEALLASAWQGACTLRLYNWEGPWLSLGHSQAPSAERLGACAAAGVGVVRRVTGGSAVLHGADLTYCVAAPEDALPRGLRGSYLLVAEALARGLRALGAPVERAGPEAGGARARDFDCFAEPAADELCARGRKLAGSAQRRARGAVLQHGSLRLAPDPPAAARAAGLEAVGATSLAELGVRASDEAVRAALAAGFAEVLGAPLRPGSLGAGERRLAAARARERAGAASPPPPLPPSISRAPSDRR